MPRDRYAFFGDPPMLRPDADEVHISCAFTWDKAEAERLQLAWSQHYEFVKLGGPAYRSMVLPFVPGMYIQPGVTFTSRGCNNTCPWCMVGSIEGKGLFQYYDFMPGHIIQDNNLLQCSKHHVERVFEMLRCQGRAVSFTGGLDSRLVTDNFVDELRTVTVDQLFLACDMDKAIKPLREATKRIGLSRDKTRCYVLLKHDPAETIDKATARLLAVWEAGAMPFAQLFQPPEKYIKYPWAWRELARKWSRPAIMKTMLAVGKLSEVSHARRIKKTL